MGIIIEFPQKGAASAPFTVQRSDRPYRCNYHKKAHITEEMTPYQYLISLSKHWENVEAHNHVRRNERTRLEEEIEELKRQKKNLAQSVKRAARAPRPPKVQTANADEVEALTAPFFEGVKK